MDSIVLDTETTGLSPKAGHRIIEIGGILLINGEPAFQAIHCYLNPECFIPAEATAIHGITNEMVANKPTFADYAEELAGELKGKELIIHNAKFDVGFLNEEFKRAGMGDKWVDKNCTVLCTLKKARKKYPKKRNSLDALCERFGVDNSSRGNHGALKDAILLAEVFFHLTGAKNKHTFDMPSDKFLHDRYLQPEERQTEIQQTKYSGNECDGEVGVIRKTIRRIFS